MNCPQRAGLGTKTSGAVSNRYAACRDFRSARRPRLGVLLRGPGDGESTMSVCVAI